MKQEEIQQKFMELQTYEEHIKLIQQQIQNLNQQIIELSSLENSLDELKKVKEDTEILVPLGAGIFTKARLLENKEVIMGVGARVHITKSVDNSKGIVKKQITEMQNIVNQAQEQLKQIAVAAQHIQQEISSEMEKNKK